jgi:uncharacterized Ntn-hydrolase superfamily protein
MTFSIAARSSDGKWWGVAVASRVLAVGRAVPAAATDVGAIATQAHCNLRYRPRGLELLRAGNSAQATVDALVAADDLRDVRQVGIVDRNGTSATHTGPNCIPWAGGCAGPNYAIQGNLLSGPQVTAAMERAWLAADEREPLGRRLLAVLLAGDRAGGDRRGRQSAALLVVTEEGAYEGGSDEYADLRVDDHLDPVLELSRLYDIRELAFRRADEAVALPLEGERLHEAAVLLDRLGYAPERQDSDAVAEALGRWAMDEFLSLRLLPPGQIDPALLDALRSRAGASWAYAN